MTRSALGAVKTTPERINAAPIAIETVTTSPRSATPRITVVNGSLVLTMLARLASIRASPSVKNTSGTTVPTT